MGYFDELAKVIGQDKEVTDRYPALTDALDRASKQAEELSQLRKQLEQLQGQLSQYHEWYANYWDPETNMTRAERALRDEMSNFKGTIGSKLEEILSYVQSGSTARTGESMYTGDDSYFKDLENRLRASGYVTADDVKRMVDEIRGAVPTKDEFQNQMAQLATIMANLYADLDSVGWQHYREFGEPLDKRKLLKFMEDNKLVSVSDAYERMVADARKAKMEEKYKQELERVRQEAEAKARREALAQARMPTDMSGTVRMGPLQARLQAQQPSGEEAPLGRGVIAQKAFEAYLREKGWSEGEEGS